MPSDDVDQNPKIPEIEPPGDAPENPSDQPIVVDIEGTLDLHTFRPEDVKELLTDYLEAACAKGFREVLIIHGKGHGVLRQRVHGILSNHPQVAGFRDAEPDRGGWGAAVVELTPPHSCVAPPGGDALAGTGTADRSRPFAAAGFPAESEEPFVLHRLSRRHLFIACALGLGLGALFHQVLVDFGADSLPALILPYGLGAGYFLIRQAAGLLQVMRRAACAALALGGLWLALRFIR